MFFWGGDKIQGNRVDYPNLVKCMAPICRQKKPSLNVTMHTATVGLQGGKCNT